MGGQPRSIVKLRFGPNTETIDRLVGGHADRFCGKAIHRIRLVAGAHHQRRERHVHAVRAIALEDIGVERVEGLERLVVGGGRRDRREHPALRCIDVDVIELAEVAGYFRSPKAERPWISCSAWAPAGRLPAAARTSTPPPRASALRRDSDVIEGPPVKSACSSSRSAVSHHHTSGNPETPYFGSGSGRPN